MVLAEGKKKRIPVRSIAVTGILAALASVLMFLDFSIPVMPGFIKLDFSELPALLAAYALGPVSGVVVCLVKNLVNLLSTSTGGVGELSNFVLGACFVLPAGLIYQKHKTRKAAFWGAVLGAVVMAVVSIFSNYYIMYPIYTAFMPMEVIIGMYQAIAPGVRTLWDALLWFNLPFTFFKGMCSVAIAFLIYKHISPLLKGKKN